MKNDTKKIFVVAGEASGDFHSANLVKEIKLLRSDVVFYGIGGSELKLQEVNLIHDYHEINFIGFTKVIKNIKKITRVLNDTVAQIKKIEPDVLILTDFPGFNLKLAEKIKPFFKGKIIYYISPQIWAWHYSRIKKIKLLIDKMLVIFPFEKEMYEKESVASEFVGHPLNNRINDYLSKNDVKTNERKIVSLMPGSRKEEIERIFPVFIEAADKISGEFNAKVKVICSENYSLAFYKKFKGTDNFEFVINSSDELLYKTLSASDLVITKIGTSSMECALLEVPFISGYKAGRMNYLIGKNLVRINSFAMVNILLKRSVVKEFIQNEMTAENIFNEAKRIFSDEKYRENMKRAFKEMKSILTDENASYNAAKIIANYL